MKKFAVIDIGSNSVRLMLVADGKVLYKALNTTRLGEGLAASTRLNADALERTAQAVSAFYARAKNEGAQKVLAFATAAARSAENGQEFVDRVQSLCGLKVEIISGEEEAEIGVLGALGNASGGIIDIGGASTEIVVKKGGQAVYKKSVNIGVVRLKDKCGRDFAALEREAESAVALFGKIPVDTDFYAIGGTATTIAAQVLQLEKYESDKVTGAVITVEKLRDLAEKFKEKSVDEIAGLPCMPKGRADVITGGVVWMLTIMETLGIDKIIASDRDNLEGYAIKRGLME